MEPTIELEQTEDRTVLTITPPDVFVMAVVGCFIDDKGRFVADTAVAMPEPSNDEDAEHVLEVTAAMFSSVIRTAAVRIKCPPDALFDRIGNDLFTGRMEKPRESDDQQSQEEEGD